MKKLLWAPGYIVIGMMYFFPTEWGSKRNVATSGRWWAYRDTIAPIISIILYASGVALLFSNKAETNSSGSPVSFPSQANQLEPIETRASENLKTNEVTSSSHSTVTSDGSSGRPAETPIFSEKKPEAQVYPHQPDSKSQETSSVVAETSPDAVNTTHSSSPSEDVTHVEQPLAEPAIQHIPGH